MKQFYFILFALLLPLTNSYSKSIDDMLSATLSIPRFCPSDCKDIAPVITDGIAPFSYQWSTGATDSVINICPTELQTKYTLTITDAMGDTKELTAYAVVAPTKQRPVPGITTPMCVGEKAYFSHPNWGWQPSYHWIAPSGEELNQKDFTIENVTSSDAGTYGLYLDYFNGCLTDTVFVELVVEDQSAKPICEDLTSCNFACSTSDFFKLRGKSTTSISTNIPKSAICGNNGEDVTSLWLGFVAQNGNHTIIFKASNCSVGGGLRFGLYDDCKLTNLLQCSPDCSLDEFIVPSNTLTPGTEYYVYVEGCGGNICDFTTKVIGTLTQSYCNDYKPMSQITDWQYFVSSFGGSSTFWRHYTGDTIINGLTYRILELEGNPNTMFLREDIKARKVYTIKANGSEKLLYDFNLKIGSSYREPLYNNLCTVTDITLIPSQIGPLKRWHFSINSNPSLTFTYDEAVGGRLLDIPATIIISDPVYGRGQVFAECQPIFNIEGINEYRSIIDSIKISICEGETYNGHSVSGTYMDTIKKEGGCSEIEVVELTINPHSTTNIDTTICYGLSYNGHATTGVYTDTIEGQSVCDSIVTLNLFVINLDTITLNEDKCVEDTLYLLGQSFTVEGQYVFEVENSLGCKQDYIANITDIMSADLIIDTTICEGQEFLGHSMSGTYTDVLVDSISGCNYNQNLTLTVLPIDDPNCISATNDLLSKIYTVFPNPTTGILYIETTKTLETVSVYNNYGKKVSFSSLNNKTIDIQIIPAGVYTIELMIEDNSYFSRFIKID